MLTPNPSPTPPLDRNERLRALIASGSSPVDIHRLALECFHRAFDLVEMARGSRGLDSVISVPLPSLDPGVQGQSMTANLKDAAGGFFEIINSRRDEQLVEASKYFKAAHSYALALNDALRDETFWSDVINPFSIAISQDEFSPARMRFGSLANLKGFETDLKQWGCELRFRCREATAKQPLLRVKIRGLDAMTINEAANLEEALPQGARWDKDAIVKHSRGLYQCLYTARYGNKYLGHVAVDINAGQPRFLRRLLTSPDNRRSGVALQLLDKVISELEPTDEAAIEALVPETSLEGLVTLRQAAFKALTSKEAKKRTLQLQERFADDPDHRFQGEVVYTIYCVGDPQKAVQRILAQ